MYTYLTRVYLLNAYRQASSPSLKASAYLEQMQWHRIVLDEAHDAFQQPIIPGAYPSLPFFFLLLLLLLFFILRFSFHSSFFFIFCLNRSSHVLCFFFFFFFSCCLFLLFFLFLMLIFFFFFFPSYVVFLPVNSHKNNSKIIFRSFESSVRALQVVRERHAVSLRRAARARACLALCRPRCRGATQKQQLLGSGIAICAVG